MHLHIFVLMKPISIRTILIVFLLPTGCTVYAQSNGKISGSLQDAKTANKIPSAIVVVWNQKTNRVVKQSLTNVNGAFTLDSLPDGILLFKASHIGYQTILRDSIIISSNNSTVNLGDLKMSIPATSILKEVTVTATKENNQLGISKKKFPVAQSLISKGGTAADLLQNIPTITIDGSGKVNLRGTTNVNVLIDGKPSLIAGANIRQLLLSLPASAIESIEVVTNPSAKYEAEGESGIINIILKKNKKSGFNGSANISAGTRNNYGTGVSIGIEDSSVNVYVNYDFQRTNTWSNGHQNIRYSVPTDAISQSNEIFPSTTINETHNIKAGIDYYLAPKIQLSLSGGFNTNKLSRNEMLNIQQSDAGKTLLQKINSRNMMDGKGTTYNANIDFIKTFRHPREELTVSIGYAYGIGHSQPFFNSYTQHIEATSNRFDTTILHPVSDNHNYYYNIQADYTLPLGTGSLGIGYRSQIRSDERNQAVYNFNNISQKYDKNYPLTNLFHSINQIHAAYLNYQNQIKNFSYQVGLRGEYAILTGDVKGYDISNIPNSLPIKVVNKRIYPAVTLTQKLERNQQWQFSYARRVSRPTPRSYSPIPDISDPVNYDVGNPNILPQDIHLLEIGYSKGWNKVNLTSSIYYRITKDFIQHIETAPVDGVITTISENIPHAYTGGLEIIGDFHLVKQWNFTFNTNIYENKTSAAPQYGIIAGQGLSWNINLTNNFIITKYIALQLRGDYHAPNVVVQDQNHASYGVDAGAKINLLHNKAFVTINGRDIFNTRKWGFLRDGNGVLLDFERRTVSASANITFTCNFGKDLFKAKKLEHSTEHQEN